MHKKIFKSTIRRRGDVIYVPKGSKPVKVLYNPALDNVFIWYEFYVGNEENIEQVRVDLVGTGHTVGDESTYVDSIVDGVYIWHVYWGYLEPVYLGNLEGDGV